MKRSVQALNGLGNTQQNKPQGSSMFIQDCKCIGTSIAINDHTSIRRSSCVPNAVTTALEP